MEIILTLTLVVVVVAFVAYLYIGVMVCAMSWYLIFTALPFLKEFIDIDIAPRARDRIICILVLPIFMLSETIKNAIKSKKEAA